MICIFLKSSATAQKRDSNCRRFEVRGGAISVILVFDRVSTRAAAARIERKAQIRKGILQKREVLELGYRSKKGGVGRN